MKRRPLFACLLALVTLGYAVADEGAAHCTDRNLTRAEAEAIARARIASGVVTSAELEHEHHRLVWSFDISKPETKEVTEIQIDARSGDVVSTITETAADEAEELQEENTKSH